MKFCKMEKNTLELRTSTVIGVSQECPEWITYEIDIYANKADIYDVEDPDSEPMYKIGTASVWRFLSEYDSEDLEAFDASQDMHNMWSDLVAPHANQHFDIEMELTYDLLYIMNFQIDEPYRGQGLGTEAILLIQNYLGSSCGLVTLQIDKRENVVKLEKWYKLLGFKQAGKTDTFFRSLLRE